MQLTVQVEELSACQVLMEEILDNTVMLRE